MADTWFTSDFHLGHFNIIRYCNRPFPDTAGMNAAILERLNASVKQDDVLYFLGDFCMGGPKAVAFAGITITSAHYLPRIVFLGLCTFAVKAVGRVRVD
jgi:calcineurin-like phosphoesterase family protein